MKLEVDIYKKLTEYDFMILMGQIKMIDNHIAND